MPECFNEMSTILKPTTASELQLYRVLQRANLLCYYDTFIEQGGDDVQQLCEAGEDEFLEIMRLVGMSSKPLHVRRLQKALQEWVRYPAQFSQSQLDLHPAATGCIGAASAATAAHLPSSSAAAAAAAANLGLPSASLPAAGSILALARQQLGSPGSAAATEQRSPLSLKQPPLSSAAVAAASAAHPLPPVASFMSAATSPGGGGLVGAVGSVADISAASWTCTSPPKSPAAVSGGCCSPASSSCATGGGIAGFGVGSPLSGTCTVHHLPAPSSAADSDDLDPECSSHSEDGSGLTSPGCMTAIQIEAIRGAAAAVCQTLPFMEPKPLNLKKPANRNIELLLSSGINTPEQVEELRRYSAIYGRFDSKRRSDKPVSLHETSVNEAAAQLCLLRPALLTRRDELFPLARMVVRESGYAYSKGHSRAAAAAAVAAAAAAAEQRLLLPATDGAIGSPTPCKRLKTEPPEDEPLSASSDSELQQQLLSQMPTPKLEARLSEIDQQLKRLATQQAELMSRLQAARGAAGDSAAAADLQLELEALSSQQIHLLSEQMELLQQERQQQQQNVRLLLAADKGEDENDDPLSQHTAATALSSAGSESSSGAIATTVTRHTLLPPEGGVRRAQQRQLVRESLFEEGLRIAKQYGLSDLATELEDMKEETRSRRALDGHIVT